MALVPLDLKRASTGADSFSFSPSSATYNNGQTFTVTVSENSVDAVNATEMDLTYDAAKLQFNSVTSGSAASSPFTLCGQSSGGAGVVNVGCAVQNTTVTGTQVIATISFTMLATSGNTAITIANTSQITLASDTSNQWNGVQTSSTYTVNVPPSVSITAPAGGAYAHTTTTISATATDNSGTGIQKVEFYNNGTLLGTDTTAPYSYAWNTIPAADGSTTLTAKAYDNNGNITTSTGVAVTINNGDVNNNGHVTIQDLSVLATNYGHTGATYAQGDLNGDGTVGIQDLSILATHYGF
jgi:hypothetical protein